jgi:hypothetical protein
MTKHNQKSRDSSALPANKKLLVYRLYIGLSNEEHPELIHSERVIEIVAKFTSSFTYNRAEGFYNGKAEETIIFTIAHKSFEKMVILIKYLCLSLKQKSIGLELNGIYYRINERGQTIQQTNPLVKGDGILQKNDQLMLSRYCKELDSGKEISKEMQTWWYFRY